MSYTALHKLLLILLFISTGSVRTQAQDTDYICSKGLSYNELLTLFQIPSATRLKSILKQKCFDDVTEKSGLMTYYERKYDRQTNNTIHHYNEFFIFTFSKPYEYRCSELTVCDKLLKQINDDAIFYVELPGQKDTYAYILKDRLRVLEMRDIPDSQIGYSYGFKVRPVTALDWDRLRAKKMADPFPTTAAERALLEYRYARVDAYSQSTTIEVQVGDKISFEAGGTIKLGEFAGSGSPNGIGGFTMYNKVAGFRHGSLLYRIGNGSWDYVTNQLKTIKVTSAGRLQLIVNDNLPDDNDGLFWVTIKLIRGR